MKSKEATTSENGSEGKEPTIGWLIAWFANRGKLDRKATPLADIDYFEAGWLTSMEVVEFVGEIESHFAMQFSDRDLQDPRFVTIGGLAELILQRSTSAQGIC